MRKIRLQNNIKYALVDNNFYKKLRVFKWYLSNGYAIRNKFGGKHTTVRMHREIMRALPSQEIDHRNGNKLDNRKSNLRVCKRKDNTKNARKYKNNTSGYKGVYFFKNRKHLSTPWIAIINVDKSSFFLGMFTSKEAAARAYNTAAKKYHGEFACLNKIRR